ncbi:MAG: SET domain-containing protein [Bacteroidetes bacterium]|nr:SET domain-containing protein [Bacteroidota bacterium]
MAYLEKQLFIKRSTIPASGKGLFTKKKIEKGQRIVEYKGKVTTWKKVNESDIFNGYVYYINRNHVIDAQKNIKTFGRYANDANGLSKIKDVRNNSTYVNDGDKIYIEATRNIDAGGEILVSYSKGYWDVVRENIRIEEEEKKNKLNKKK